MKTKSNVQKTILRSAAVVVSFVLVSFTVRAQELWIRILENSIFNDIALAMVEAPRETQHSTTPAESLEANYFANDVEPKMKMENWMTDYSKFDVNTSLYYNIFDVNLNVEEWMLDSDLFEVTGEDEGNMEVEAWMTSADVWSI
jgi:hypothetical protein